MKIIIGKDGHSSRVEDDNGNNVRGVEEVRVEVRAGQGASKAYLTLNMVETEMLPGKSAWMAADPYAPDSGLQQLKRIEFVSGQVVELDI